MNGDCAPSRATFFNWFVEFRRGRQNLKDEPRSGRPLTAVTDKNTAVVNYLIKENRHITYEEIEAILSRVCLPLLNSTN